MAIWPQDLPGGVIYDALAGGPCEEPLVLSGKEWPIRGEPDGKGKLLRLTW